jgi:hypothetical protein
VVQPRTLESPLQLGLDRVLRRGPKEDRPRRSRSSAPAEIAPERVQLAFRMLTSARRDAGRVVSFPEGQKRAVQLFFNRADPNDWEFDVFPCGPSLAGGAMLSAPLNPIYHWIFG